MSAMTAEEWYAELWNEVFPQDITPTKTRSPLLLQPASPTPQGQTPAFQDDTKESLPVVVKSSLLFPSQNKKKDKKRPKRVLFPSALKVLGQPVHSQQKDSREGSTVVTGASFSKSLALVHWRDLKPKAKKTEKKLSVNVSSLSHIEKNAERSLTSSLLALSSSPHDQTSQEDYSTLAPIEVPRSSRPLLPRQAKQLTAPPALKRLPPLAPYDSKPLVRTNISHLPSSQKGGSLPPHDNLTWYRLLLLLQTRLPLDIAHQVLHHAYTQPKPPYRLFYSQDRDSFQTALNIPSEGWKTKILILTLPKNTPGIWALAISITLHVQSSGLKPPHLLNPPLPGNPEKRKLQEEKQAKLLQERREQEARLEPQSLFITISFRFDEGKKGVYTDHDCMRTVVWDEGRETVVVWIGRGEESESRLLEEFLKRGKMKIMATTGWRWNVEVACVRGGVYVC